MGVGCRCRGRGSLQVYGLTGCCNSCNAPMIMLGKRMREMHGIKAVGLWT